MKYRISCRVAKVTLLVAAICFVGNTAAPVASAQSPTTEAMQREYDYVVGIGDVLALSVWREDQLQATVPVRPDGRITVPLLGEIEVVGRTPQDLQVELTEGYEGFVTAPAVSLVVREINSRKVFVLGEVAEPGAFDMLRPTRLLQVLAMAGGFTEFAKKDEVVVIREAPGGTERLEVSVKAITTGRKPGDNILLLPGDTIYIP